MSNLDSVISIVPRLPPSIDGVGDYALNLARQLRKDFNIQTKFIVGDSAWDGAAKIEGFVVSKIPARTPGALLCELAENTSAPILLHYVGYGYARRGCPRWLVQGLQHWKNADPNRSLLTMFHEISASGPIWTSAFWLSQLQRNLAARLVQLSDRCITSKQLYADIIAKFGNGKHDRVPFLPIFSNIGEPNELPLDLSERQRRLVIFGGIANRARVYQQSQKVIEDVCVKLNIQEIWDIGNPTGIAPACIGEVPIIETGEQSAARISDILTHSLVGFLDYNPDFLAKSTIFAAYCAHKLLPINTKSSLLIIDEIESGKHYWSPNVCELQNGVEIQSIANNAYLWYQSHNLSSHTNLFASQLLT